MISKQPQVLLGARVPEGLKKNVFKYCVNHGMKMSYFVTQALREKLAEIMEDMADVEIANKRLKNPKYISQAQMEKYFSKTS